MKPWLPLIFLFQTIVAVNAQTNYPPYKLSLKLDIPLSAGALGLLGTAFALGTKQHLPPADSLVSLDPKTINNFDRSATRQNSKLAGYISDATLYTSIALPLLQLINRNSRNDFGKVAAINAEVFVLNVAITDLVKETVKRKRPLLYNPGVPMEKKLKKDNFKSFYSGHTSTVSCMSFCFAKMYADYNPGSKLKPMVWSLCAAFPVLTGALRYKAGKHFWTDVIAGYAAGALIGLGVPYLHATSLKFNQ